MTQTNVSAQQLKIIIDRIERVSEEIDGLKSDVKEIYAEAKGNGFDTKIIRAIVRLRKLSAAERQEMDALMETYMAAIGMEA